YGQPARLIVVLTCAPGAVAILHIALQLQIFLYCKDIPRQPLFHRLFLRLHCFSFLQEAIQMENSKLSHISSWDPKTNLLRALVPAVLVIALIASATSSALASDRNNFGEHWVASWQGSPMTGGTFFSPGCPSDVGLTNQTIRNIVYLSAGGDKVRVRISNAFGANPLNVGAATVAISAGGAATVPGSLQPLTFNGKPSIIVAADSEALSDPVNLRIPPLTTLAISVFLPDSPGLATQHFLAVQTNYLAVGDESTVADGTGFSQAISCWMFVSGVDVLTSPRVKGALVTLGDSITDGYLSTTNANRRYPDVIARRLAALHGETLSVSSAAITGNELLTNRPTFPQFGVPVAARLGRDVLLQPDVKAVILLAGINDIGDVGTTADVLIAVDQQ